MSKRSHPFHQLGNPRVLVALLLLATLIACGSPTPPSGTGRVEGEISVGGSSQAHGASTSAAVDEAFAAVPVSPRSPSSEEAIGEDGHRGRSSHRPFVPGELIVAFKDGVRVAAAAPELAAAGLPLQAIRPLSAAGAHLYRVAAAGLPDLLQVAAELEARPDVRYAHPNYLLFPALAPTDPEYDRQWHYGAIGLEDAWEISTGSSSVVVAVLDTGILKNHPDLQGRLLSGYDFISDVTISNDGDGRDPDPTDTVPTEDFHGTHVAGTIGAATNNGTGVAGVDWQAKILPVRVLGDGGGSIADIADAIRWAVGGSVSGVPGNSNPAGVVNLSLGGPSPDCYGILNDAIAYASMRAVVVAAAGNTSESANLFTPANCPGAIVVGATDRGGERAPYSNFGARIDVMAPGGDLTAGLSHGILSTGAGNGYTMMQGTSMAAPHVSGVAALMLSLDPDLTTFEVLAHLRDSARPLTDEECDSSGVGERTLYSFDCGAGLIDALGALEGAQSGEPPPPPPPVEGPELSFSPPILDLGANQDQATFTVTNIGDEPASWTFTSYYDTADNPSPVVDGAIATSRIEGELDPGESQDVVIYLDRGLLDAEGYYVIYLIFQVDGEEDLYQVRFTKLSTPSVADLSGPMLVAAFKEDPQGGLVESGSTSSSGVITSFSFEVESGQNLIVAWSDENGNDSVDEGDFLGYHDTWVTVPVDQTVSGVDVSVLPVVGVRDPSLVAALEGLTRAR